jgi:protein TonB
MSATAQAPQQDESGMLGPALFLALVVHLILILGISFEMVPQDRPARITLDVTWVTDPQPLPEDETADHIAPQDQAGGGDAAEDRTARSPEPIGEAPVDPAPVDLAPVPLEPLPPAETVEAVVTAAPDAAPAPPVPDPAPEVSPLPPPPDTPSAALLMARGLEAARAAPAETPATQLARASRTRYLDTLSARAAPEAAYLEAWIRKVERIGNLNYPDEARRRGLSGSLVLSVRLDAEGRLLDVGITQSSGEPILDQAAIRIVELAQPFAAFTEDMRESYDQLVITRTWAFRRDRVERVR